MTNQQLAFIIQSLRAQPPTQGALPPSTTVSTNLAKCTARYNGVADVLAFIDSVQIYKECVGVSDDIALRGLPMLLTDFAATWWQGVKHSVLSWQEAISLLRQTFGPRLPPHRIYREIFSREQREERTDVFVCRVRALIAQLAPNTLPENPVQLDMVYGLLHKRIREKIVRTAFTSFTELLQQARVVEEVLEEGSAVAPTGKNTSTCAYPSPSAAQASTSPPASDVKPEKASQSKPRPRCSFCKMFGHVKEDCRRIKNKLTPAPVKSEPAAAASELRPAITCFGCGAPGVIRSNCKTCKEKNTPPPSTTAFQSVSVGEFVLSPRVRPIFNIEVFGAIGTALLDTGAKQSVASDSLAKHLRSNGQVFNSVETELRFADGSQRVQVVETALVNVKVQEVEVSTLFMVLPGAIDSLLGMNFIRDAGMVLDFQKNRFSLRSTEFQELMYETTNHAVVSAAVTLREGEGTLLCPADKEQLSRLLEENKEIFGAGGGPTPFAMHRIDTGNTAPISTPPYRVTPILPQRFEVLAMDLFGPLPEGSQGEKYIFLVEDTASRWVELIPLTDATAESCARALIEEVFLRYGFPRRVISDNGVQFVSAVMQKALHVLGVNQNLTPVYHPEANPAERKNREMKQMLAMMIDPEHRRWPEALPSVRFALNTAPNQGTGHSAAYLTFAREFRSPLDVACDLRAVVEQENYVPQITPYLRDFVERLQEVKWRVERQQDLRKESADKARRPGPTYKEGDLVLLESHRASQAVKGFTSKFAPRREGPYRVSRVISPTTYEVVDGEGTPRGKYHASLLTPYAGGCGAITHARKKGRPRKTASPKPAPESSAGLEGEDIVPRSNPASRPCRMRRAPVRYAAPLPSHPSSS
ncbi:uncharacterized protein LOC123869746 [Maniola jurtina]|uniref:uncharacterized protein LOC123869746 n=1 Tax=Maniola jurtina TaxID=191418 RepID=UPI001E68F39B|nr:uncharacterized protein LOC123869746 [Maniola jurtina]